ncbi:MAG TPA: magnesium/cobalt transporter CorA [Gemmatimonadales bacterium]|nr:magnesium/cobalt transporter CorA [Gemmatimonadales bacterium]
MPRRPSKSTSATSLHVLGSPPGTLVAHPDAAAPTIRVMAFGPDELIEEEVATPEQIHRLLGRHPVVWVNVDGLGSAETVQSIGELFRLHPLALEDVLHTRQRPKLEDYDDHLYVILLMAEYHERLETEQMSLFLGTNFVVTFQEHPGDSFNTIRTRLREKRGQIRNRDADYLAYSLIDAVIDGYFPVLESYGDLLDSIERDIGYRPTTDALGDVQTTKRELRRLRRAIWPVRDFLSTLQREPSPLISEHSVVYFRDCSDHAVRILDLVESYREWSSDLTELFISTVNMRMNDIMRVLTIMATIFIPLTFVAGVYGMNFRRMPELEWSLGYPLVMAGMAALGIALLIYFRRKGWLGDGSLSRPPEP